ncbi:fimbrial protein [Pseudomonas nitroreducens]|uniref:fimbrial protein n=1 Tax=Pseudomonas nitroreducens TaxID=46680 RepID=UPI002F354194
MRLVSTGQILPGTLNPMTPVKSYAYVAPSVNTSLSKDFVISNSVNFIALSCLVSDVNVPLPDVYRFAFDTNVVAKTTPFKLVLSGCPAGMNSVTYSINPVGNAYDISNGVINNDAGPNQAQGVGIRLTNYSSGAAVRLDGTEYPVADYNSVSGNSSIEISMNASYYRTGTVSSGLVHGALEVMMYYR